MGIEERTTGSVPKDFRLSKDSAQRVQLYPHGGRDEPPYPCPGKGCLTFSNLSLIRPECPWKIRLVPGSGFHHLPSSSGQAFTIFPTPPSCQFNGQTGRNQLLGLPPLFVICGLYGWLLRLTIPMHAP
jgi:hypothetical protein